MLFRATFASSTPDFVFFTPFASSTVTLPTTASIASTARCCTTGASPARSKRIARSHCSSAAVTSCVWPGRRSSYAHSKCTAEGASAVIEAVIEADVEAVNEGIIEADVEAANEGIIEADVEAVNEGIIEADVEDMMDVEVATGTSMRRKRREDGGNGSPSKGRTSSAGLAEEAAGCDLTGRDRWATLSELLKGEDNTEMDGASWLGTEGRDGLGERRPDFGSW